MNSDTGKKLTYTAILLAIFVFVVAWQKLFVDYNISFLAPSIHAQWITPSKPFSPLIKDTKENVAFFRAKFSVDTVTSHDVLYVRALKIFKVMVDDKLVFQSSPDLRKWKQRQSIELPTLQPGNHELVIIVLNNNGPPALLLYSDKLALSTDESWEYRRPDGGWEHVDLAGKRKQSEISRKYPSTFAAFVKTLPYGIGVLLLCFVVVKNRRKIKPDDPLLFTRYLLLAGWLAYFIAGLLNAKIMGFDSFAHLQYVDFVANKWRIPYANDGWEMFQSPLYYMVNAILLTLFKSIFTVNTSYQLLTIIPMLCLLAQIEIGYRCSRYVFPDNRFAQLVTLWFCGLAPVSLYMSQFIGNEVFTSAISAWVILLVFRAIRQPAYIQSMQGKIQLGCALGLALLSKVTPILLIVPVFSAIIVTLIREKAATKQLSLIVATVGGIAFALSGWYYIRNWVVLGKPFIGGWDASRGIVWWQEPGFRTWQDFTTFGHALISPIYSATYGLWDSLYSTFWLDGLLGAVANFEQPLPWHVDFMTALALLSIVPTIGLIAGLLVTLRNIIAGKASAIVIFSVTVTLFYTAAIVYFYLAAPTFVAAKAGYCLGILPCLGIITAVGLNELAKSKNIKFVVSSLLVWWGMFSYIAFFPA